MAEEIRTETDSYYEEDCRKDSNNVEHLHKRKVTKTITYYDDGTSRVTDIERGDWYDTGSPC